MMESNEVLDRLPRHLMDLVIDQPYNEYTAQDHAVWRYVMRRNVDYLTRVAHGSYLDGLKRTGISIDRIPHMYGMNRILKDIGWAAVAVDGFIPPAGFMEFQAYNVLVIAADIRPIDQIEYTPAPDIIHEAAGHAPIIANEEYAEYLRYFGEIGHKAFSSAKDYEVYEAIRYLSILKADPYTEPSMIEKAEHSLDELEKTHSMPSEMSQIRNLHWWTVEYGLIGDLEKPKIYGAGLLSSIGESYSALLAEVKKIPYSIDAAHQGFDITTRQPQLYVTPDFKTLTDVLDEYADTMALRVGGVEGILKAIDSNNTGTCTFSSGLQVSGTFTDVIINQERPVYLKTTGPTSLAFKNKQLDGHGKKYHAHGFGSPVGRFQGQDKAPELLLDAELREQGIEVDNFCEILFESGLTVKGQLVEILRREGRILLMTFKDCKALFRDKVLFEPDWGVFDMAVGENIVSAFSGPADADAFELRFPVPKEKTHKIIHSEKSKHLHSIYQRIREIREGEAESNGLGQLWQELEDKYPEDWLAPLEMLEILKSIKHPNGLEHKITSRLQKLKENKAYAELIKNGLDMLK